MVQLQHFLDQVGAECLPGLRPVPGTPSRGGRAPSRERVQALNCLAFIPHARIRYPPTSTMTAPSETARAWVDVDLDALVANARTLAAACGTPLLPMVKANGYGLGAVAGGARPRAARSVGLSGWPRQRRARRCARLGSRRPILVVSPLTADALDAILSLGSPSHDRRPGRAPAPGWPAAERSIPSRDRYRDGPRRGSAGTMRRPSPSAPARLGAGSGVGRRVHPLSLRRHRSRGPPPSSGDASRRRSRPCPGASAGPCRQQRGALVRPRLRRRSDPARASSCTAVRPAAGPGAATGGGAASSRGGGPPCGAGRERELRRHLAARPARRRSPRSRSATPTACRERPIAVRPAHRAASSFAGARSRSSAESRWTCAWPR